MPETATFYTPGLKFKAAANAQGHDEICFSGSPDIRNPDGSLQREALRMLVAEFGVYGSEYTYIDPLTETTETGSDFRGGFFDLDAQAAEKGWDEREREIVAHHMLKMVRSGNAKFTLYSAPKVSAPWPTYDETPYGKIAELATPLGFVAEALSYEEQTKNRKTVVAELREALTADTVEDEVTVDDEQLTAA